MIEVNVGYHTGSQKKVLRVRINSGPKCRGLYFGKYPPPPPGGKYRLMSFGGKNMKRRREKRGKCKRKRKKERGKIMRKGEVKG
jgi:hypothetical protein